MVAKREPVAQLIEFEFVKPFPETYCGKKVGPAIVTRALKVGFFVLAKIDEAPVEVPVSNARRGIAGALEVLVLEGWRIPWALRTVDPRKMKGVKL